MRLSILFLALSGLAACSPAPPQEASGPGFTDYNTYLNQRAAAAMAAQPVPVPPAAPAPATTGFSTDLVAGAIDEAEGIAPAPTEVAPLDPLDPTLVPSGTRPRGDAPAGIEEQSGEVQDFVTEGVSDEQDFEAVSARETIESDKARIEANRAQYVVVQPGDLPVRPGDTGPNIVEFALRTTNPIGVALYDRTGIALMRHEAACAKYASPDQAQQDFLASGGPERDRKNLDPDGDGFACSWDPTPFRAALQ